MTYRALIFDMDGTLLDNMHIHNTIWSEYLAERGIHLTPTEIGQQTASLPNPQIIRMYLGSDLEPERVNAMATEKEDRYRARLAGGAIEPLPGLRAFLDQIAAAGLPRALASSASRVNLDFTLMALRLERFFHAVVSSEDVQHGKPHPEPFLTAAARLGVSPAECLVFEDSPFGLEAAQRAGMRAVALTTSHTVEELEHFPHLVGLTPDYRAVALAEVLEGRMTKTGEKGGRMKAEG